MSRLPLALLVWVAAVLGAIELSSAVAGSIHTGSASGSGSGAGSSTDSADATATTPGSLFTPGGFGHALAVVRAHAGAGARAETAVVYPGYFNASVVRGATEMDTTAYTDGRVVAISSTFVPSSDPLLPLARLHAGDTAAVAARLRRVAGISLSQLRYMVPQIDPDTHRFEWLVYLTPGSRITYLQVPAGRGRILAETSGGGLAPIGR